MQWLNFQKEQFVFVLVWLILMLLLHNSWQHVAFSASGIICIWSWYDAAQSRRFDSYHKVCLGKWFNQRNDSNSRRNDLYLSYHIRWPPRSVLDDKWRFLHLERFPHGIVMFYIGEIVVIHTKVWPKFVLLVISGPDTDGLIDVLTIIGKKRMSESYICKRWLQHGWWRWHFYSWSICCRPVQVGLSQEFRVSDRSAAQQHLIICVNTTRHL